jgi:hypothetical protein
MHVGIALCVLIVFSLHRESLKLILVDEPLPEGVLSQSTYKMVNTRNNPCNGQPSSNNNNSNNPANLEQLIAMQNQLM